MPRTTSSAVLLLLTPGGDYDTVNEPSLDPYIETASAVVDDVAACAADKDEALTAARLELIERWLAAHFYQQSDPGYLSRSTADASASFKGEKGEGLASTNYGRTAMTLDPSGCLASVGSLRRASGDWLGKAESEWLDYEDRN